MLLIFAILCVSILWLGYLYYEYQASSLQKTVEAELGTIADLKVGQLLIWRQERMHDALLMLDDPIFAGKVQDWFNGQGPPGLQEEIHHRLAGLKQDFYVNVALYDHQGEPRLSNPLMSPELKATVEPIVLEAIRTQKVIFSDLYRVPGADQIYMSLVTPIHVHRAGELVNVGVILLQIDPQHFLYPIISSWPSPTETAELVLVRREGEREVLYLNELRHSKNPPLTLRVPLTDTQLPAVQAALGHEGIVRGRDYRGVPVLAANKTIPDSPWILTAKIDVSEVMAPLHRLAYLIPSLILALLATAGLSVAFIWRSREAQFYRQEYQSEAERRALSQRYEYLTRYANDIILVMDRDWKIVEANDQAVASYGYERRELFDLYLWDLFAATIPPSEVKRLALEAQDGLRFEAVHRRQDGTTFPAEISSSLMEIGQDQLYQYIIRDVSDRKRRERAIKESERQLRYLSSQLLIVQENERSRISKELHDELGQALMIVKYQISSIETRLPKNRKTLKEDCYAVIHYLDSTIENVRRLSRDLTPSALEQFGLSTAIKNLLEEFGKYIEIHWLPAQMKEINDLFSPLAQINIYRIFQEALTNIGKHAQASQILIDIAKRDKAMVFTIKDNGKGFDPKASPGDDKHKGIGVAAMHERARIAGGCLEIWSRPGQGTKLSFEIPVRQENN